MVALLGIIISVIRLLFAFAVEMLIVIQIFSVPKDTDSRDQVADFLILLLILQIDNMLIELPLYSDMEVQWG